MSKDPLFDVSGEIVIVTGAFGQLGASYTKAFLSRGARVVALDRGSTREAMARVFGQWECSDRLLCLEADVTVKASLEAALRVTQERFGTPTVLINNAAIDSPPDSDAPENGPFEDYPEASFDRVMSVNVKGTYLACQVFGSRMAAGAGGSIINIASIYGMVSPDQSIYEYRRRQGDTFFKPVAYSISKSAIYNLTRYLATYWAKAGVRVNTVTLAGVLRSQDPEFLKAYCARIPIGRMAESDEYDGMILFLASRASRYMTAANVVMDGGWTAI